LENSSILVVEDEALIRMTAMDILDEAGYRVFAAANADEAMIVLESGAEIVAVLTDINMPGAMDGLELSRVICQRWPQIGLIITSGRFLARAAQIPAGAHFISKPYMPAQITDALRRCVA
jgi:CheY-like chemotaxis protein